MAPIETFAALREIAGLRHGFFGRVEGVDVSSEKAEALRRLDEHHQNFRTAVGVGRFPFLTAEQTHGRGIAIVESRPDHDQCFADCDGIVTNQPGVCAGIYVADCCAIFILDPVRHNFGLVHSGRKGTELNIVGAGIDTLAERFGSLPADLVVQLSPCIRPPDYEVDFAAEIAGQCRQRGVAQIHDCGISTAANLDRYYSYRMEKGRTGRMLAVVAFA